MKMFAWRAGQGHCVILQHLTRFDSKMFLESISKLHRENVTGSLEISESVTSKMTMKSRYCKFVTRGQLN